jgi:spore germination cell wall hydrolase CwlJ-like protein
MMQLKNKLLFVFVIFLSLTLIYLNVSTLSKIVTNNYVAENVAQSYTKQVECLAKNIYYEAGHESYEGKLAVAQVTLNRTNNSRFPQDICDVVYQRDGSTCQFSWTCETQHALHDKYSWEECVYIAKRAMMDPFVHPELARLNVLYYHASYVDPGWSKKGQVITIGNHIFYKRI